MSDIVVFGYSGYVGNHITEELLSRGHSVAGVARKINMDLLARQNLAAYTRQNLTTYIGSAHDSAEQMAAKGPDVIVVAIPAAPGGDGEPDLANTLSLLLDAAGRSGARLGVIGGAATLLIDEGGPLFIDSTMWRPEFDAEGTAHVRALNRLRTYDGPADWFCLTPPPGFGAWSPGERTGAYRLGDDVLLRNSDNDLSISGPDLAVAVADEIEHPKHHRVRFTVGY
jgi:putative NADH-flavin reductase